MSEAELVDYCKKNNVTMLAVNQDNTKQVRKTEIGDDFSKRVKSFWSLKDSEILSLAEDLSGVPDVSGEIVEKSDRKFLKITAKTKDSGGEFILTQYITVNNGIKEILSFYTADGEDNGYIEDFFESEFNAESTPTALRVIYIIGIVLFSVLAVITLWAIIKETFYKN